jgi:hypothetical protein
MPRLFQNLDSYENLQETSGNHVFLYHSILQFPVNCPLNQTYEVCFKSAPYLQWQRALQVAAIFDALFVGRCQCFKVETPRDK